MAKRLTRRRLFEILAAPPFMSGLARGARTTADVVATVNFAPDGRGASNAADSPLIWTLAMNAIVPRDALVGAGCEDWSADGFTRAN